MKRFLLFVFIGLQLPGFNTEAQSLSLKEFINISSLSPRKMDDYISKKKFVQASKWFRNDTLVIGYNLKLQKDDTLHIRRSIETYQKGTDFSFVFNTSSPGECENVKRELKEAGFICENQADTCNKSLLFQQKNMSVLVRAIIGQDENTMYSLLFHEEKLPIPSTIRFAEDLLRFTSHQYLISTFGEKNVKKDVYYFSNNQINKCSILFPQTRKQAVFIWQDEINLCGLSYIVIGGNMPTESLITYKDIVAENTWMSKEGVYSGMTLSNLARLNGNDFKFYGKNSEFPFMVVPENTGSINFKRNLVVLGCLSPNGSQLLDNSIVSTDKILNENPGMYVYLLMLSPAGLK